MSWILNAGGSWAIPIGANLRLPNRVRGTVYVVAHGVLWSMFALKGANRPD